MRRGIHLIIISLAFLLQAGHAGAQLSLEECQERARANYPLAREHDLIERARALDLSITRAGYLPRFSFAAGATYQSEVTRLPVALPGVATLNRDQYRVTIDLDQVIWDGGTIAARERIAGAEAGRRHGETRVALHALRERVNQLFFGILLADEQLKYNSMSRGELLNMLEQVNARVVQGIASEVDADVVRVELVRVARQEVEIRSARDACKEMLGEMTGEVIGELVKPTVAVRDPAGGDRHPEIVLSRVQEELLASRRRLLDAGSRPRVSFFLQGGYGNPGLNMLKNAFSTYYAGGVRLSWNIGNLYTLGKERLQVDAQREMVATRRDAFLLNRSVELARGEGELSKWQGMLEQDDKIILLQERIVESIAARARAGTASILEWTREISRLDQSRQARVLHEIQWLLAGHALKQVNGE